jgi:limonene-1,2-epoxide hydrolase
VSDTNNIRVSISRGSASHPAVKAIFGAFAAADIDRIMELVTPDVELELGNSGPIHGIDHARAVTEQVYAATRTIEHDVINEWLIGNEIIVQATAIYDRIADGRKIRLPSMAAIALNGDGLIMKYKVFFDVSPLYAE